MEYFENSNALFERIIAERYQSVCKEMRANPFFRDLLKASFRVACSGQIDNYLTQIICDVSSDGREIKLRTVRSEKELNGEGFENGLLYRQVTLRLTDDDYLEVFTINNRAFEIEEYQRKYRGLRYEQEVFPEFPPEYNTVYCISYESQIFNKLGIEICQSRYSDFCPRKEKDYSNFLEECFARCPEKWPLYNYPSSIAPGKQEFMPRRSYAYRTLDKFGIICSYKTWSENGIKMESLSKYDCDNRFPNQLAPLNKLFEMVNGVYVAKSSDYPISSEEDQEIFERTMNIKFIKSLNYQDMYDPNPVVFDNTKRSAAFGLLHGDSFEEKKDKFERENYPQKHFINK